MATLADHLWEYLKREYLKRPDIIEQIKTWDAALVRLTEALRGPCNEISAAIQRVAELSAFARLRADAR